VVLKQFYECCKNCVRETDIVARIGGEEFVILLPETGESDAIELAQRVRLAVKQLLIPVEQGEIRITVSIGVTEWNKDAFRGIEEMMQYADKALYEAKEGGRNQVVSFSHFQ
jgi:diguanylate cyclase (GGDEF)-like protein